MKVISLKNNSRSRFETRGFTVKFTIKYNLFYKAKFKTKLKVHLNHGGLQYPSSSLPNPMSLPSYTDMSASALLNHPYKLSGNLLNL